MKNLYRKLMTLIAPSVALVLLFAAVASAHVTVSPSQSGVGAWETYTLKVPVEKDSPTVQIDLRMPAGVEFKQYEATPGWKVTIDGNKVSWIATGDGIQSGQFQRFTFTAKNPDQAGKVVWDAYQHYADGSLVQWSGEEGSESPHSITEISGTAAAGGHSHGMDMDMGEGTDTATSSSTSPVGYIALIASILALILAVIGLFRRRQA
ncbi:YcnI family protein [Paenibacillus sp. NPDC056722]|uniref:YcnI family copper-binding membrane protein n=1 Tax=Paenibacillus sp. NPDC056722 TaxID=3345924 RepID=UPI0036BCCAF7